MRKFFARTDVVAGQWPDPDRPEKMIPRPIPVEPEEFEEAVRAHRNGRIRIGTYAPSPGDSLTPYLCFDLDAGPTKADPLSNIHLTAKEIVRRLQDDGPCYIEVSGSGDGLHIWVLFKPSPAKAVREYARKVLDGVFEAGLVEVYPKTDKLPEGAMGNLVWLPYWGDKCRVLDPATGAFVPPEKLKVRDALEVQDPAHYMSGMGIDAGDVEMPKSRTSTALGQALLNAGSRGVPSLDELERMLAVIPNEEGYEQSYDDWLRILAAIYHGWGEPARTLAEGWSAQSSKHTAAKFNKSWRSFEGRSGEGSAGCGTIIFLAKEHGYVEAPVDLGFMDVTIEEGSHSELAKFLLHQYGAENLVHDQGHFWLFNGVSWEVLTSSTVGRELVQLDGTQFQAGWTKEGLPKTRTLRIGSGDVTGATRLLAMLAEAPGFFDEASPGVAFRNGFLSTQGVTAHKRDQRCRLYIDLDFDENAQAPLWRDTLLGHYHPTQAAFLQEFLGACLFGTAASYATAVLMLGGGSDGKSQILDVAGALFGGGSAVTSISPDSWDHEYSRARLANALFNRVYEMPSADLIGSEAVKAIIAGDPVSARHIREAEFEFKPRAGHLFAANALPKTTDLSHGFWRRWRVIVSPGPVPEEQKIQDLGQLIIDTEMAGVYAWAYEGFQRLQAAPARGSYVTEPKGHRETMERWKRASDSVAAFLADCTSRIDEGGCDVQKLYTEYRMWSHTRGRQALGRSNFEGSLHREVGWDGSGNVPVRMKHSA